LKQYFTFFIYYKRGRKVGGERPHIRNTHIDMNFKQIIMGRDI